MANQTYQWKRYPENIPPSDVALEVAVKTRYDVLLDSAKYIDGRFYYFSGWTGLVVNEELTNVVGWLMLTPPDFD